MTTHRGIRRTNASAIDVTIAALELGSEYEALIVACRSMARAMDRSPDNAALWREYRLMLVELVGLAAEEPLDDDVAAFLASLRTPGVPPEIRDRPES
jgi:hypothetical protein